MANIKSQIKRIKQSEKARIRNKAVKSDLKTKIKKFEQSISEKNKDQAKDQLKEVVIGLNKAASKGVIHKKRAGAKQSSMTKKLNAL